MSIMQKLFYQPVTGFFVGLVLLVITWSTLAGARWLSRCLLLIAPIAWFTYSCYEIYMVRIWEPRVHGPIRFDLVLLFPAMCALSVLSLVVWAWLIWRSRSDR
jgi:hypothetical protein